MRNKNCFVNDHSLFFPPQQNFLGKKQNPKLAISTLFIFPFLMPIQFLSQSSWFEAKKQFLNLLLPPFQHSYFALPFLFSFYLFWILLTFICGFLLLALRSWCFPNIPSLCYLVTLPTFFVITNSTVMAIFKKIIPNFRYLYLNLNRFLHLQTQLTYFCPDRFLLLRLPHRKQHHSLSSISHT